MGSTGIVVTLALFLASACSQQPLFSRFDMAGNNVLTSSLGAQASTFSRRFGQAFYSDGLSAPQTGLPNPRAVSNALFSSVTAPYNSHSVSLFATFIGQLVAHDMILTMADASAGILNTSVPAGDGHMDPTNTGTQILKLKRLKFDPSTGTTRPRAPINGQTHFLDASAVYGATAERAAMLRTFRHGLMLSDPVNGLPRNLKSPTVPMAGHFGNSQDQRIAGDIRANVNPGLMALHGVFVLEHNRQAALIREAHPEWNDERLFQEARKRVIALLQHVVYNEYIPTILREGMPAYSGYNPEVDPSVSLEFAIAAYRYGHSGITTTYWCINDDGSFCREGNILLRDAYFKPSYLDHSTIADWLRGGIMQPEGNIDTAMVDDLRNHLEGIRDDLAAIDILRAREVGLPSFAEARRLYGLRPPLTMNDITPNTVVASALALLYNNDPSKVDLWVGGLAEAASSSEFLGETFKAIIKEQFIRTRDGDRFWFENDALGHYENGAFVPYLTADEREEIKSTTLADIIRRNTKANIPSSVLRVPTTWPSASGSTGSTGSDGGGNSGSSGGSGGSSGGSAAPTKNTLTISSAMSIEWMAPTAGETDITITATLQGTGWFAIGFGSGMADADVIMMRVSGGNPEAIDASSSGYRLPVPDGSQDVTVVSGSESGGVSTVTFRRKLNTGDSNDKPIVSGGNDVIAAWDPSSDTFGQHTGPNRVAGLRADFFANSGGNGTGSGGSSFSDSDLAAQVLAARLAAYGFHGLTMFATWGVIVPVGVFGVRFFKHLPQWHSFHRWTMMLATSVTIPAAGAAIAATTSGEVLAHSYVGVTVAGTVLIQVATGTVTRQVMAVQANPKRGFFLTKIAHRGFGWFLTLAGMTNCFLGVSELIPDARYFVLSYFIVIVLGFIALTVWDNVMSARHSLTSEEAISRKQATKAVASSQHSLTMTDVKNARRIGSKWVMIQGRVYDVTSYAQHHPGGAYLLERFAGSDITALFLGKQAPDSSVARHSHSSRAFSLLQTMFIGVLRSSASSKSAAGKKRAWARTALGAASAFRSRVSGVTSTRDVFNSLGRSRRRSSAGTGPIEWQVVERTIVTPAVSRPVVRLALEHPSYEAGAVLEWRPETLGQYVMVSFPVESGDDDASSVGTAATAISRHPSSGKGGRPKRRVTAKRRASIIQMLSGQSGSGQDEVSRPYTVVRRPGTNGFYLYVRRYPPPAEVSPLVHKLEVGSFVKATRPTGIGVQLDDTSRGTVLAIAQGTGLATYMDLIRFLVKQQWQREELGMPESYENWLAPPSEAPLTAYGSSVANMTASSVGSEGRGRQQQQPDMLFGGLAPPPPSRRPEPAAPSSASVKRGVALGSVAHRGSSRRGEEDHSDVELAGMESPSMGNDETDAHHADDSSDGESALDELLDAEPRETEVGSESDSSAAAAAANTAAKARRHAKRRVGAAEAPPSETDMLGGSLRHKVSPPLAREDYVASTRERASRRAQAWAVTDGKAMPASARSPEPFGAPMGGHPPGGGGLTEAARANLGLGIRLVLVVCIATEEDLFEAEWLQEAASLCSNFELHLNITRPTGASSGVTNVASTSTGYLTTKRLSALLDEDQLLMVSICGTGKFSSGIREQLVSIGIPESLISAV